ncbi:MAG: pitrilysin family protein [Cyanobacteria bacterium P01_D01_bin.73]
MPLTISAKAAPTVTVLDSGLTVIHHAISDSAVVTMDVWVKAGSRVEPEPWAGMAHFLEHMIFKGTENLAPGVFDQVVEGVGGSTNAATSYDYAHYYVTVAADQGRTALAPLADLLVGAAIPDEEFSRERSVVLEEIRQAADNPDWLGYEALLAMVYPDHPYGRPILGTPETLMGRSPKEMRQFHRCHYQPKNMTVAIAGQVDRDTAMEWVEEMFGRFPYPESCLTKVTAIAPTLPRGDRQHMKLPYLEQARLMMGWRCPGWAEQETTHGLDMLAVILGTGRMSRLVRELREERQWVYDIACECDVQTDSTLFSITAWLDMDQVERVEAFIKEQLQALGDRPVEQAELDRAKRLLINDHQFSGETPSQLAALYGFYNTMGTFDEALTYPKHVQAISTSLIQQVAQEYLANSHYCAVILEPDTGEEDEE